MTDLTRVRPELRAALQMMPPFTFSNELLPFIREGAAAMTKDIPFPAGAPRAREVFIPGPAGAPDVRVLLFDTGSGKKERAGIVHMHGGGYLFGSADMMSVQNASIAMDLDCIVVSVDYRLAPETRHPGPIEDCYAALKWLVGEADTLGVDRARIGVMGESAGGGLAASLALLARDRGEFPLAFQHLNYPMLDDRTCTLPDPHPFTGEHVWNAESNAYAWGALLGKAPGGSDVSIYAAPARATDLRRLPPTYISVGSLDLFLEEDVAYALRLTRADVPVELHVLQGAPHAYEIAPTASVTLNAARDSRAALVRFIAKPE